MRPARSPLTLGSDLAHLQIAEVLTGHEQLLRRLSEPWIVESSQACTVNAAVPGAPNLISPCLAWEENERPSGRRLQAQAAGLDQPTQPQPQPPQQPRAPQGGLQDLEGGDPGSTALVVTIVGDRLFCANVGDCRLLVAGACVRGRAEGTEACQGGG